MIPFPTVYVAQVLAVNIYLVWLLLYSVLLVAAGAILSRKVRQASDFLVAGRNLGAGLIFSTFLAANIGAGSTVNATTLGYQLGWSAWWWVGSAGIGCLILANTVGPRIWEIARAGNFQTLGDFLEYRYSRAVRGLVAAILWVGSLVLLSAQLIALSILFNVVTGVPQWVGSMVGGLVMILYFAAGGLFSSAWINFLQLIVLGIGFSLAAIAAPGFAGGWDRISQSVMAQLGPEQGSRYTSLVGIGVSGVLYYVALLAPSFIVSPGLIQKLYGARSAAAARRGINANAIALMAFAAIPAALGIVAAARFPQLADPQYALFRVMTDSVPLWLGVLGIAAIFSAEVSTCDAILLMLSSSLTVDLYRRFMYPSASDRVLLYVGRATAVIAGLLGILISIAVPSIIESLTFFYSLVSVALFVPVVSGIYSKRPTAFAALAAIGISVPATLVLRYGPSGTVLGANPVLTGMIISLIILWGLSWGRPPRTPFSSNGSRNQ